MNIIPKCSFRIIGLSEAELSSLSNKYLAGIKYRKGRNHKDKDKMVLRVIIDEQVTASILNSLINDCSDDIYYDFFISVSSEQETAVVSIPRLVLDLYKNVGGEMSFSYTCTSDVD